LVFPIHTELRSTVNHTSYEWYNLWKLAARGYVIGKSLRAADVGDHGACFWIEGAAEIRGTVRGNVKKKKKKAKHSRYRPGQAQRVPGS